MIDGATNFFGNFMESLFSTKATSHAASDPREDEKRWYPVDDVGDKVMSLYHCKDTSSMGIYYIRPVPSADLERCYRTIAGRPRGAQLASNLLEPFQSHQTGNMRSACLRPETLQRFLKTLENQNIAVLTAGSLMTSETISKLHAARIIFVPSQVDSHWYLTVITRIRPGIYSIEVLDSSNNQSMHSQLALQAKEVLLQMNDGKSVRITNEANPTCLIPQQEGCIDDGTAIAYFAHKVAQGESLETYAPYFRCRCDFVQFRIYMAFQIQAHEPEAGPASCFTTSPTVLVQYSNKTKGQDRKQEHEKDLVSRRNRPIKVMH